MTGNVVVFEIHALTCVVLRIPEQHVPYGEVIGSTECIAL